MKHNEDKRDNIIANEYWMSKEDIELLDNFRDLLYCKYAIREELNNRNCLVDMRGIEAWAKQLEETRQKIVI